MNREERARELAARLGYALTSRRRMNGEIAGDLYWVSRLGETPVLDARYAADLGDLERVLTADLPGFGIEELHDATAGRAVWLISSRIASAGRLRVFELPDDRLAVVDLDLGLLAVHHDLEAFVAAGYDLHLTAAVIFTVIGAGVIAP